MNFAESEIQGQIRELARKFARSTIAPRVTEDDQTETFRPEWIRALGELGLTGIPIPETLGGAGLGAQELAVAIEEIARVSAAYAVSLGVSGMPQSILFLHGTEAQKKRWITPLARGEAVGAFSLSEASSGSDAGSLRTTAVRDGARYILNGTKLWTTQADSAGVILVMARTGEGGPRGISAFVVEAGTPGLSFGKREKKMGLGASHTMELIFDQVAIPADHRVGQEGEGFKIALEALDSGRINIAATALGVATEAFEVAKHHAQIRTQFGKPIGEFQGIGFLLADLYSLLESSRLLIARAAWRKDQGLPYSREAAMAKLVATDSAMRITTEAVQILGGSGYTTEFPTERLMREAKVLQIVEGTSQVQRIVISHGLLKETTVVPSR